VPHSDKKAHDATKLAEEQAATIKQHNEAIVAAKATANNLEREKTGLEQQLRSAHDTASHISQERDAFEKDLGEANRKFDEMKKGMELIKRDRDEARTQLEKVKEEQEEEVRREEKRMKMADDELGKNLAAIGDDDEGDGYMDVVDAFLKSIGYNQS
jgi:chromosome segregation ATPase